MSNIYSTDIQQWEDFVRTYYGQISEALSRRTRSSSELEWAMSLDRDSHSILVSYTSGGVSKIQRISIANFSAYIDADIQRIVAEVEAFLRTASEAEQTRINNETTRQTQETERESYETTRRNNEDARNTAESTREAHETTRQSNETTRTTNWANWFSDTLSTGVRKIWNDWFSDTLSTGVRSRWNEFWAIVNTSWMDFWGTSESDPGGVRKQWSDLHSQATADHTQASSDHTASVAATNEASNVNAQLSGYTVIITNRQGQSSSVDIGFEIYRTYATVAAMNADAANVPQGKFVVIATTSATDPDNAKMYCKNSQGGFTFLTDLDQASAEAWADWLNNKKPLIEQATSDANTAASNANAKAGAAQTAADTANTAASNANTQANRAKGYSDHPWEIRQDGYIWVWNEATSQMTRTNKMIIDFDDLTPAQRQALIDSIVMATVEESISAANELT